MPQYLARKPLTVNGERIQAGQPVSMERLDSTRQRQLIEHGMVYQHEVRVSTTSGGSERERGRDPRRER